MVPGFALENNCCGWNCWYLAGSILSIMNFVLISPVGADVDLMPKTRPGRMTGTSVSTPTPWRDVHRLLLPHRVIRLARITITLTLLSINGRTFLAGRTRTRFLRACWGIFFYLLRCFPFTIFFPISNQRPLLLPLTQLGTLSQQRYSTRRDAAAEDN